MVQRKADDTLTTIKKKTTKWCPRGKRKARQFIQHYGLTN